MSNYYSAKGIILILLNSIPQKNFWPEILWLGKFSKKFQKFQVIPEDKVPQNLKKLILIQENFWDVFQENLV